MLIGSQKKPSLCLIQTKVGEVDKTAILRRLALFPGPCSGPSCIVVKNPAGYISFCLNILYLNLMIQEAIVTWPVQTVWFRNDTIFKPVCSDYCWIFIFFLFLYFIKGEKASAIDIAPKIDGFERPYFVLFHWIKLITIKHLITNLTF